MTEFILRVKAVDFMRDSCGILSHWVAAAAAILCVQAVQMNRQDKL